MEAHPEHPDGRRGALVLPTPSQFMSKISLSGSASCMDMSRYDLLVPEFLN